MEDKGFYREWKIGIFANSQTDTRLSELIRFKTQNNLQRLSGLRGFHPLVPLIQAIQNQSPGFFSSWFATEKKPNTRHHAALRLRKVFFFLSTRLESLTSKLTCPCLVV